MKKSKLLALALAAAMMATLFAGCGNANTKPSAQPSAQPTAGTGSEGGAFNLSLSIASEPQTIDPTLNSAVDGAIMIQHMFEGLMKWGDSGNVAAGGINAAELVNGQAESYEKKDNGDGTVTYTFKLRSDAKWSDGKAVTAGDFEYSWKRLVNPATASDYENMAGMIAGYQDIHDGKADPDTLAVKAVDDTTLEVTLSYDCPYFLEVTAFPALLPVREDMITSAGDNWTFEPTTYIGTAPIRWWSGSTTLRSSWRRTPSTMTTLSWAPIPLPLS